MLNGLSDLKLSFPNEWCYKARRVSCHKEYICKLIYKISSWGRAPLERLGGRDTWEHFSLGDASSASTTQELRSCSHGSKHPPTHWAGRALSTQRWFFKHAECKSHGGLAGGQTKCGKVGAPEGVPWESRKWIWEGDIGDGVEPSRRRRWTWNGWLGKPQTRNSCRIE